MDELIDARMGWEWVSSHDSFYLMRGNTEERFVSARSCMSLKQKQATSDRIGGLLLGFEVQSARTTPFLKWRQTRPNQDWTRFQRPNQCLESLTLGRLGGGDQGSRLSGAIQIKRGSKLDV